MSLPSRRDVYLSLVIVFGVATSAWLAYLERSKKLKNTVNSGLNSTSELEAKPAIIRKTQEQPIPVKDSQKAVELIRQLRGTAIVTDRGQVVSINLLGSAVKDEDLIHLSATPDIKLLNLDNTSIGDEGLKFIRDLPRLKTLKLSRTKITDAGLRNLKNLPQLQMIYLNDTMITDEGLKDFSDLPALNSIELMGCPTTSAAKDIVREQFPNCSLKL